MSMSGAATLHSRVGSGKSQSLRNQMPAKIFLSHKNKIIAQAVHLGKGEGRGGQTESFFRMH